MLAHAPEGHEVGFRQNLASVEQQQGSTQLVFAETLSVTCSRKAQERSGDKLDKHVSEMNGTSLVDMDQLLKSSLNTVSLSQVSECFINSLRIRACAIFASTHHSGRSSCKAWCLCSDLLWIGM